MLVACLVSLPAKAGPPEKTTTNGGDAVSYYRQVRPILQANCQGCHQPAKAKGGFVMTEFKKLLAGGEDEGAAAVPGHPEKSSIITMVTPKDGEARMPKGKAALGEEEVDLISTWIKEGANDDTPPDANKHYDTEHPPIYTQPPVISSVDFSPDGQLLAVAGFHEVLLHKGDGSEVVARLIGLSERVQAVRFSPDGEWLAVAGGDPARLGEVQVWDVAKRKLAVSAPVAYDTLYGLSWSPDSKLIAFGCPDNTVRAIEAATGKQVVQMGSHSDWALSTTFSVKGDHIISGGRDMSVKLTEVASQRFIDNVTSITPGALKGGVLSVATHPLIEHIVTGGSDGLPKVYRIFRETKREIGDDAQFIADLFPLPGRVFSVRFSADGKRIACGSSLDGAGEILVCSYDYTNDVPKNLRDLMGKVPGTRKTDEKKQLEDYRKEGIRELARIAVTNSAIYTVAFAPNGNTIAAAGSDGKVRFFDATSGAVTREFLSVPRIEVNMVAAKPAWAGVVPKSSATTASPESLPKGAKVTNLEIQPANLKFARRNEYAQLLVTAHLDSGDTVDATRLVKFSIEGKVAEVSARGVLRPVANGSAKLGAELAGQRAEAAIEVAGLGDHYDADFIRDVGPVLAKVGCNAGTCHGAKEGKNGFKLSLRGYDPETDLRALTDDLASRRVNVASPDDSLMLLKAVAEVPHEGGRVMPADSKYYQILRQWISGGAKLDMKSPRVVKLDLFPQNPVVQTIGSRQQIRIVASYADGTARDVTAEAFVESGNADVATADGTGLITTLRRGEAPVLARYEGNYAATTVTVMGDRSGFVWKDAPTWNKIDELVAAKWQRMKIEPSELCTDIEFIRRVYLDLTGLPPTPDEIRAFLADSREVRAKRDELIDKLVGSSDYIDHWANKWADLLQVNSKYLGREGAESFRAWIRSEVEKNTPYDQFARKILTASGSNRENPPASYWKIVRTPTEAMENTTHLFLATRFNCNKCHDHPFERWTQDQYYQTAAFFAQVSLKADPASGDKKIGGTAVEGAQPLYEIVTNAPEGEVKHDRTGKVTAPKFPFPAKFEKTENEPRREELAAWITTPDNRYFASSYANRLWGYLTGVGVIEPLDDIRAGNPPSNPELLSHLTHEFVNSGFNVQYMMKLICKSRTYQLSIRPTKWNEDDKINYSHALARRLPAETLFDAVFQVTGAIPNIPGAKAGQRASQLSDAGMDVSSGLLATLGRPARQSACECERSSDIRLGSVMALLSGPTVSSAINDPTNALARLVESEQDDRKLVNEVFLRILNRPANDPEIDKAVNLVAALAKDHTTLTNELGPLEVKMAPVIADLQRQREEAIAKAKADLGTYDENTKFLRAELAKRREEQITVASRELKDYEKLLPAQAAYWESKNNLADIKTAWIALDAKDYKATDKKTKLTKLKDKSILVVGANGQTDFRIVAETGLTNITGIMLEVLPDERLPKFGPGRAADGNFVLSEFDLKWAEGTNAPDTVAKFVDAKADFSQKDYPVKEAIDGKIEGGRNGWAIAGAAGISRHIATFKLEKPISATNDVALGFKMTHRFGDSYMPGRFRLYVTAAEDPLDFGLPESVAQAVRAPAGERTSEQAAAVIDYYRASDTEFWKRKQILVTAKTPLPVDPKFTELKQSLAKAEEPIRLDPHLVQLREDTKMSATQEENKRLTAVQDLAWALINSGAFLFNH
jgi:WD40 repeat protein/mono/diheme cytochrome c family protein